MGSDPLPRLDLTPVPAYSSSEKKGILSAFPPTHFPDPVSPLELTMKQPRILYWLPLGALFLGTLIGSGAIWNWQSAQREEARLQIEKAKASAALREKGTRLLIDIVGFQGDAEKRKANYAEYRSKIDGFNSIEKSLAKIESREYRTIDFESLLPGSPAGLRIESH
jgi:hypothetical protein